MVSTSIATVKTSTLPEARVTPPIRAVPVPVDTTILVAPTVVIAFCSVVATLVEENLLVIGFP
jgi:hypothetical protein